MRDRGKRSVMEIFQQSKLSITERDDGLALGNNMYTRGNKNEKFYVHLVELTDYTVLQGFPKKDARFLKIEKYF